MQYEVVESQPYPGIWHVEGIDEPIVASRSEGALARDLAAALGQPGPRGRREGIPGQEQLFN